MKKRPRTQRIRTSAIATIAAGLIAGLVGIAPARAASGCNDERLHTLEVKMAAVRSSYARGEVARIKVSVTRDVAGHESDVAVTGAHVVVSAQAGESVLSGGAITGEDGKAVVKVKIRRAAPTGPADGFGYAWRKIAHAPCIPQEDGHVEIERLFRITK